MHQREGISMAIASSLLQSLNEIEYLYPDQDDRTRIDLWKSDAIRLGADKFIGKVHNNRSEFWAIERKSNKLISCYDTASNKVVYAIDTESSLDGRVTT